MPATGPVVDVRHAHSAEQDLGVHLVHRSFHVVGRARSRQGLRTHARHTDVLSSTAPYLQPSESGHCRDRRLTNLKEHSDNILLGLMTSDSVEAILFGDISEDVFGSV